MYNFKTPINSLILSNHGCRATPGDIVTCNTDRLKNFTKGLHYKVERIKETPFRYGANQLQLFGIKGFIDSSKFILLSKSDARDIKISNILDTTSEPVTVKPTTESKINMVDDKNYQLFELIMNRMSRDRNRLKYDNEYTDFDTMIDKISEGDRIWGVKSEDFNELKSMTVEQIFNLFIETKKKK